MRRTRRAWAIVGALLAGVVLALGLALPNITAFAEDAISGEKDALASEAAEPATKADEATAPADEPAAQADTASGTYPIYWYALIPGKTVDGGGDPNQTWYGLGVSTISGVNDPKTYTKGTILSVYGAISTKDASTALFPKITFNNVTYQYAEPGSPNASKQGYYTLTPIRVMAADGANDGNNHYNPSVGSGTTTFHYDNIITLNEKDIFTVNFEVQDPATDAWSAVNGFAQRVDSGYAESKLKQPTVGSDVPSTKTVNGVTYDFDGWYTDQACTTKATFTGNITKNTVYYGHYVPRLGSLSITKSVSGSAANASEHFTFELTCADLAGKTFTIEGLANDEVAHGNEVTFDQNGAATLQLKHGETATIKDLPAGATISVRETNLSGNAKTSTTATVNGDNPTEVKPASSTATSTNSVKAGIIKGSTAEVSFLNTAYVQPSTGVSVNATPMAALLCVAAVGGLVLAVQRKRQHDARKE